MDPVVALQEVAAEKKNVTVMLTDGSWVNGRLEAADQHTNILLRDAQKGSIDQATNTVAPPQAPSAGLLYIRGENVLGVTCTDV